MIEAEKYLIDLVKEAQSGDQKALLAIIHRFYPAIKKVKKKISSQEQEDLEQELLEKIIRAILLYDLNMEIDLSHFKESIKAFMNEKHKEA